ncbi:MAG: hypothetical protein HPY83_03645 [Anaerolineae bacterium]|nr:hypothetical protein [Anaerolineae bacterium]
MSLLRGLTRRWQLGGAYEASRTEALRLAQDQMDGGVPRQEICDLLRSSLPSRRAPRALQAYADVAAELQKVMVQRNAQAGKLEQAGKLREAIELYEANVADRFVGEQPYERLLEIYSRRGDFRNAARVGEAYLRVLPRLPGRPERSAALEQQLQVWRDRVRPGVSGLSG